MAKRANGEGSIYKRKDGKWLVTFPTGLYTERGKKAYYCIRRWRVAAGAVASGHSAA